MDIQCDIRTHYDSMTKDEDINMRSTRAGTTGIEGPGEMDEKGDMLSIKGDVSGWVGDP